jgi:cell division protein FtsQ
MSIAMDTRIAMRRHLVLEDDARRRLPWLIGFFGVVTMAGLLLSLVRSPLLDIDEVRVSGARNADVSSALVAEGIALGSPTLSVDTERLAARIEEDPWVARVDVAVVWPETLEITVLEHQSVAWIESRNGWMRVSAAGTVIARGTPPGAAAQVRISGPVAGKLGEELASRPARAAIDFLANLPPELRRRARVSGDSGKMVANVRGTRVELGIADQMAEKAAIVAGIVADGPLPDGSILNVVAPSRPAISNPQARVEGSTSPRSELSTSG